jgi:hypothetical protein
MSREWLNTRNPTRKLVLIILADMQLGGREVMREWQRKRSPTRRPGADTGAERRAGAAGRPRWWPRGETRARGQAAWSGGEQRLQSARGWPTGARCAGNGRLIVRGGAPGAWSACSLSSCRPVAISLAVSHRGARRQQTTRSGARWTPMLLQLSPAWRSRTASERWS